MSRRLTIGVVVALVACVTLVGGCTAPPRSVATLVPTGIQSPVPWETASQVSTTPAGPLALGGALLQASDLTASKRAWAVSWLFNPSGSTVTVAADSAAGAFTDVVVHDASGATVYDYQATRPLLRGPGPRLRDGLFDGRLRFVLTPGHVQQTAVHLPALQPGTYQVVVSTAFEVVASTESTAPGPHYPAKTPPMTVVVK